MKVQKSFSAFDLGNNLKSASKVLLLKENLQFLWVINAFQRVPISFMAPDCEHEHLDGPFCVRISVSEHFGSSKRNKTCCSVVRSERLTRIINGHSLIRSCWKMLLAFGALSTCPYCRCFGHAACPTLV